MNIDSLLKKRGDRYGGIKDVGQTNDMICTALETGKSWNALTPGQRYALRNIATKLARIANGDPSYADSWVDVGGYARLGEKECSDTSETG
jgi:hypothetical protein